MKIIFEQIEDEQVPQNVPIQSTQKNFPSGRSAINQIQDSPWLTVTEGCPKSRSEWNDIDESANRHWGINE